jgi:hypothetical protein
MAQYNISNFLRDVEDRNHIVDQDTRLIWEKSKLVHAVVSATDDKTERQVEELLAAALAGITKMNFHGLSLEDGCSVMMLTGDLISATNLIYRPTIAPNPNDVGQDDEEEEEEDEQALERKRKEERAKVAKARRQAIAAFGGAPTASTATTSTKLPVDAKPAPRRRMTHADRLAEKKKLAGKK